MRMKERLKWVQKREEWNVKREIDRERVGCGEDENGETIGEKHGDRSEPETRSCVEFVKSQF